MIPYGRQSIDDDDVAAVAEVLRGDWLTQGPAVTAFEADVAERVGARHAVAFANGTAALHAAAIATGLGPDDVVVTSSLSFVASANCARYVGADVGFVDIDPRTLNLDPGAVPANADGLVAVHYAGLPIDLAALAHRPRVVIEDAAQALGAWTPDGPVGNCARSDVCVFSLHPVKSITSAEGGLATTNDDALADRMRLARSHGVRHDPQQGGWYYEIDTLGFNYRLSDVHAALGRSQLRKLDVFLAKRTALADRYRDLLADLPLELPPAAPPGWGHALHLFVIRVPARRAVYDRLRGEGIGVQVHFVPIHHHPLYGGGSTHDLPNTDAAYEAILSLPLFPDLSDDQQDVVVDGLRRALAT